MASRDSQEAPRPDRDVPEERSRRAVTPLLLQTHATECGAACLGSVLAYFGRWVPLTELRGTCEVGRDGSTAAGLKRAAEHYGLECSGWSVELKWLRQMPLPMILFWEFNHFVVLEGFDRKWFYLNDPATGRRKLSAQEFEAGFTGVALQFRAGPEFQPGGTLSNLWQRLPQWLRGTSGGLAYAIACGLLLAVLALTVPFSASLFVDHVVGENEPWGLLVAGTLAAAACLVYGVSWLKGWFLRRLAIRMSIAFGNRCVSRLLRLPVEYFSHRLVGELTTRILSIDRIARSLSELFLGLLIDIAMSTVFLAVMVAYDLSLALVILGLTLLNALLLRPVARVRSEEAAALRHEQGWLAGVGTLMLSHADTLRMTASEDRMFARWSGHQARELGARQRFAELGNLTAATPDLLMILGSAAVLAIGATKVMSGELTLGALLAFYLVSTLFLEPAGRFVEFAFERQTLLTDMQRLDDITETPRDPGLVRPSGTSEAIATFNGRLRLAGHVELRGVTFGYNRNRRPLIEDLSLVVEPGQRVAVVGPSGSGKSTLSRLVAGILHPWSGEILFDGRPRHEIPAEVLSRSLSMVDQQVVLFSATVRDNLTLWSPAVLEDDIIAAARDAGIHDEIIGRPLGYATPVDEDGGNLSGGQRQRLEIARALVGNPTVLILDEATSSLDTTTEARVDDALRRRGVSCLIVAHRLSTVRDCDQIIVMNEGMEVRRGTHDELMRDADGLYHRLVQTELGG
ncbi:cysteine peptidase family C39 domain-containing protein [Candidatus Palauibacter sp.]|uniref:cysteine peptidase family C39 domain-containing protein n=1 Tax=Candidatus Palauibacter sp. TaxID=3101350 RepID=UPI003B52047A